MLCIKFFILPSADSSLKLKFVVYMDDVAFVAPDSETMQQVLRKVSELSRILGFRVNSGKTKIYH